MSSPWKDAQPEVIMGKVLKRVEVSKMARKLQNRLALAQFKTNRGWEDLSFETIEPKVEDELRRRRPLSSGEILSDSSSSSASEFQYTNVRTLLSSPLKAAVLSDQVYPGGSSGHRKRTYNTFQHSSSSSGSRKRHRSSPSASRSVDSSHTSWKDQHQLSQSSPIKPRRQSCFTTSQGPNLSFYERSTNMSNHCDLANTSDDEENLAPTHSFDIRSSPPRTPSPIRKQSSLSRRVQDTGVKSGEEGADLLLYLATSPSPARPNAKARIQVPSTPPPKNPTLPSSMMNTPGAGNGPLSVFGAPNTPSQGFDFSDFVNITPSPAQNPWPKTPRTIKTPLTVARRRLTFENFPPSTSSPNI